MSPAGREDPLPAEAAAAQRAIDPDTAGQDEGRLEALRGLESWLETPMRVLGFVWLALLVAELAWGLSPALELASVAIWVVFLLDFALRFALAPRKLAYLREHWLTAVSLLLPALRVVRTLRALRVLRAARATRGLRLVKVVGSINRGMRALRASMERRGAGYVIALTALVTLVGAAGMRAFEGAPDGRGLNDYGTALWWTAMLVTTMGSDYWPRTAEGRALCLLLAVYSFAVFGYVTATLASFFIGRDAADPQAEVASARAVEALHEEIRALRRDLAEHAERDRPSRPAGPPA